METNISDQTAPFTFYSPYAGRKLFRKLVSNVQNLMPLCPTLHPPWEPYISPSSKSSSWASSIVYSGYSVMPRPFPTELHAEEVKNFSKFSLTRFCCESVCRLNGLSIYICDFFNLLKTPVLIPPTLLGVDSLSPVFPFNVNLQCSPTEFHPIFNT